MLHISTGFHILIVLARNFNHILLLVLFGHILATELLPDIIDYSLCPFCNGRKAIIVNSQFSSKIIGEKFVTCVTVTVCNSSSHKVQSFKSTDKRYDLITIGNVEFFFLLP